MKRLITVVILFAATVFARAADDTKPAKPAPAPQRMTIPKDAVKEANGSWSYTDAQGKKWVYRESPFGVMRTAAPETGADARPNPKQPTAAIKVTDKGDTVQFERATPFGPTRWEKKKSDLTDDERKMFDAQYPSKPETQTQTETQDQDQNGKPDAK
jgi:hypothetical protein